MRNGMAAAAVVVAALSLAACAPQRSAGWVSTVYDRSNPLNHITYTQSPTDDVGGGRISMAGQFDPWGRFHKIYASYGETTNQQESVALAYSIPQGLGFAAGMGLNGALTRPARTTISNVANSAGSSANSAGGSIGAGATSPLLSAVQTGASASANPSVVANGGTGGMGGTAFGGTGFGGSAVATGGTAFGGIANASSSSAALSSSSVTSSIANHVMGGGSSCRGNCAPHNNHDP